jgi:hypothetical protein
VDLRTQIETLRRRFWDGDESARDALKQLLERYVRLIVLRAIRKKDLPPWLSTFFRGSTANSCAGDQPRQNQAALLADEISRQLCRELLQFPVASPCRDNKAETIRSPPKTVPLPKSS